MLLGLLAVFQQHLIGLNKKTIGSEDQVYINK